MPNFLNPSSFVLSLDSQTYSGAEFTIQTMMLPDVTAEGAPLQFKQVNIATVSDKITFGTFEVSYLIDEDLLNYKEIFDWLKSNVETNHTATNHVRDLTLTIMNSANNVTKQIKFIDAYPTSLSSLPFDITTTDVEYLTAVVMFQYSYYQFL
jgi:transcriptional regulator of nitric oxide reductase